MPLLRFTKPRVASATGTTIQGSKCSRSARPHPLRNGAQSRQYASEPIIPKVQNSDFTFKFAGVAMAFTGGLYFAINSDLRPSSKQNLAANLQPHPTMPGKMAGENEENMRSHKITMKGDPSAPGAGRPDPNEELGPKAMGHGAAPSHVADPADPRGKPRSFNYMSGKQEGLSNGDTHHSSQISKQGEMSKKGEGVAETAKLKGTVSTKRPGPENKEQRGKAQMDDE